MSIVAGSNNGYEEEWEKVYGKDKDPVRQFLIYPELDKEVFSTNARNIVDAGCGNGGLLKRYSDLNFENAIGVDLSPKFIEIASADNTDDRVKYIVGDLESTLKIKSSWADLILSVFVLNEVENLNIAMKEISRILDAKGTLVIVLTHPFQMIFQDLGLNKSPKFTGDTDYFSENEVTYHFSLSNATARYYHHNFQHLSSALQTNSLVIRKIKELTTNSNKFKEFPDYWKKRAIPLYMILRVTKT